MKTLQIVGDSKFGGATILLLAWCRFLREQGCEVEVLTTDPATQERLERIPGVKIVGDIYIPRDVSPLADMRALTKLTALLRRNCYDVVHTYTAVPGFVGRLAARLAGVPMILHHQAGWTINEFSSGIKRLVFGRLEYLATAISTHAICVSQATMQQAREERLAPLNKLVTICNGIDAEPFLPKQASGIEVEARRNSLSTPHSQPSTRLVIGNSGRLSALKDNASLLRAVERLREQMPGREIRVRLAGDGPERDNLQALAAELGLAENVEFLGFTRDIPGFLRTLDVFVSPSWREGLSVALLEAMATGLPIVSTDIAPNAELIEHEVTGLLVPVQSPEAIAQAVGRYAMSATLAERCGQNARERALKRYTLDRMCRETWALYQQIPAERQVHGAPVRTTQAT